VYGFFSAHLSPRTAEFLTALVYATMLLLIMYYVFEPQAEFNYLTL
jgi:hypothetical protein